MSNELKSNEIWLEGQELEIRKYRKLYQVYGNTYGEASDSEHFVVPNFIGRSIWGISSDESFGYIEAGLPSIEHSHGCSLNLVNNQVTSSSKGAHTHLNFCSTDRGTSADSKDTQYLTASQQVASLWYGGYAAYNLARTTQAANVGRSNSAGAHTHTVKSNVTGTATVSTYNDSGLYGLSDTVQPAALKVRVKTRAK